DAYLALAKNKEAQSDYYRASNFWWGADRAKGRLCDFGIRFPDKYFDLTLSDCREAFASVFSPLHNGITDPATGVRIADLLLRDGDVSGACSVVFPHYVDGPPELARFLQDPRIKTMQDRVRSALKLLGMKSCHVDFKEFGPKVPD